MFEEKLRERTARAQAALSWALKSESVQRINAMLDLARSEQGIPIQPDELDRDPWLFNCSNGTLDLRSGRLREHRSEDYITKFCRVAYDREARAPTWENFMATIFDSNAALIQYIQKLLGYCLTGAVSEQIFPIFWGKGANGKSTLINAIMGMMGEDYAIKASRDLFMAKKQDNHPAQLARLFRKRLVVCVETHEGERLDEGLVKEATGGDPITARRMRENPWQFDPTHKVILITNHKPEIRGTDHGIWRRCKLIPFTVQIADHVQDKALPEKLANEYPGILAWCVEGCMRWQREGMEAPSEVRAATEMYRSQQDVLGAFIAERCVEGNDYRVKAGDLFRSYTQWCKQTGEEAKSQRRFGEALAERGYRRYLSNGVWYQGIAVRQDNPEEMASE